jgi:hypothetical protein
MSRYSRLALLGGLAALALTGCARPGTDSAGAPSGAAGANGPTPAVVEPSPVGEYRVTYGFDIPSRLLTISPPKPSPGASLVEGLAPYLVGVYVSDHPSENPAYQRISFYWRGGFPSYNFSYVPTVVSDARGDQIPLQGNAFLRMVFRGYAHDNDGRDTISSQPDDPINFQNLKEFALAGDYEGYVSYGLGLQTAPNSDQLSKIRAGELKKPDGSGGFFYVIHFDIQTA